MIVTTLDTFTSLMAGCTIFGILGNLMHEMGTNDISKVVRGGTGLAFISYPDALSRFTVVPQLFSVLFFFMIFVLGTGSVLALSTAIFSILCDLLPKVSNWKLVLGVCTIGYLCGIVYISPVSIRLFILSGNFISHYYSLNDILPSDAKLRKGRSVVCNSCRLLWWNIHSNYRWCF